MKTLHILSVTAVLTAALTTVGMASRGPESADAAAERGRYLVQISGCNDCHTPGYMESSGQVPIERWLTGSPVGFSGPWGTTYPSNLRLLVDGLSEEQWLQRAHAAARPPMPWFNLSAMSEEDLRALYRFIRGLGAAGEPAPAYVPPGETVTTPYFEFVPKTPATPTQVAG